MSAPPAPIDAAFCADVAGNRITVLPGGPERLAELLALVAGAEKRIGLLFYIYADDSSGTALRDALTEAARRGVRVTMLLDSFGSAGTADSFFAPLREAGGTVRWFGTRWGRRYLIRNHQKLVVVDGRVAMAGGFNIADAYFSDGVRDGWRDIGFTIAGPAVAGAERWMRSLSRWMALPRPSWRRLRRLVARWRGGAGAVSWQVGGPTTRLSPWARCLRRDLLTASRFDTSMAYFAPSAGVTGKIAAIARRGGTARLVLPARTDNPATVGAARLIYGFLLKRGVAIHEYEPERLHTKLIVIDDVVMIGSANLDMRSLYVNMELMLRVEDAGFAAAARAHIDTQAALSTRVDETLHRRRAGVLTRARWLLSWAVVSVLDYGVTRRLNFGLRDEQDRVS
jgi:cardiolipin synthase A/B